MRLSDENILVTYTVSEGVYDEYSDIYVARNYQYFDNFDKALKSYISKIQAFNYGRFCSYVEKGKYSAIRLSRTVTVDGVDEYNVLMLDISKPYGEGIYCV